MRTRPCVRPLRFSLQKSPRTGSKKKFPLGLESGKNSRTQLQLSEEWKVWRTQLQLSEECGKQAANLEPVHSSPSSNQKAAFQPFQDGLFHHFDFVSKYLIATSSLHVPTTNQFVSSPPRTATPSGTINNYDMGWRFALRAICSATDS
ncbi:hypothetical protein TNCV_273511 [Trichonephila clavipes]|nr:hypothetical protein TNCV_273511 [Trichonephila clavipes]